jgi:hypothetical protein
MAEINVVGTTNLEVTPESEQIQVGNFSGDPTVGEVQPSTDDYDNIPIPGELLGEQSKQESNTEQAVTTESVEPAETEEPNEPQQELSDSEEETSYYETEDGEQFTVEDIESWKKDADNRHEWSKSNTEKAQEVADQRRAVEPLVQLVEQLNKSEEFKDTLKEAIEDELGEEAGQLFEQSLKMENKDLPNPFESELAEAKEKVEMMEAEKVLDQSMSNLQTQ